MTSQDQPQAHAPESASGRTLAELAATSEVIEHDQPGKASASQIRSAISRRNDAASISGESQEQLANVLTAAILLKNWNFSFREEPINANDVAGPRSLLPALLWQVEKMHRVAYGGKSTGILYAPDENNTTVGAAAVLPHSGPRSPMALFAIEALQRMQDAFPTPDGAAVDSMVQEFFDDHDEGLIPWAPGTEAKPSLPMSRQGAAA